MQSDELDSTGARRALVESAHENQHERAEGIYRAVAPLRDLLPVEAQKHMASVFEWAREGLRRQIEADATPELEALHAACTYARDVLVATIEKRASGHGS